MLAVNVSGHFNGMLGVNISAFNTVSVLNECLNLEYVMRPLHLLESAVEVSFIFFSVLFVNAKFN
jgi:hypothetical protein